MDSKISSRIPIHKRLLIGIVFAPILAFFPGHFFNFLPSPALDYWGKWSAGVLSFIFFSFYCYAAATNKLDHTYDRPKSKAMRWIMHAFMPIFLFGFFYVSCAYGFGFMLHSLSNFQSTVSVTVCDKDKYSRAGCTLDFEEYDYLWYKQLQHIHRYLWDQIQVGDKLTLLGTRSVFGFRPNAIE